MELKKIPFADTKAFSQFFLDYIQQKETLKPFYYEFPSPSNFNSPLTNKGKSFSQESRKTLVSALHDQYKDLDISEITRNQIVSLGNEKTFTVTTGHQLNICTGPLYFIFKIVSAINACKELKHQYPAYHFVPVYWMASEDHDYNEIKYFRHDGKKIVWETAQSGAVGRFATTGLDELLKALPGNVSLFINAYNKHKTLAKAVRQYVNDLFGDEGLLVVDGDDRSLKQALAPVMRDDILENKILPLVQHTNGELENLGYNTQVFCREINFFYLGDQLRGRLEKENGHFKVLDTNLRFTSAELSEMIAKEPEKLSPNVILRPLYQELILPNLAYIGGPAEVVYWLQLKGVFEFYKVPFPLLMPRNFGMVIDHVTYRKLNKTGLSLESFFETKNYLYNEWVAKNSNHELSVGSERDTLVATYEKLQAKAAQIDKTLMPFVRAEAKRLQNSLEKIEKKFLRAEKRLHADKLRQIGEVKDSLFPNGSLQERTDNFLNFYQKDPAFIKTLLAKFDPFDYRFNILIYPPDDQSGSAQNLS